MRCLALDISSSVGWIAFSRPGAIVGLGTWHLPPRHQLGARFALFEDWLREGCAVLQPSILAFEEPIRGVPGRAAGIDKSAALPVLKLLQGLAAVAELTAARCAVPRCIEVTTSSAKLKLGGHGRATKRSMVSAAIQMGVPVGDEHQADALAVAMCAYEHCGVAVKGHGGPLLADQERW
jgi:Holliday junction resolvasome RuvABC endonuclease subunit